MYGFFKHNKQITCGTMQQVSRDGPRTRMCEELRNKVRSMDALGDKSRRREFLCDMPPLSSIAHDQPICKI